MSVLQPPLPPPMPPLPPKLPPVLPVEPSDAKGTPLAVGDRVHGIDGGEDCPTGRVVNLVRRNVIEIRYDNTGVVWRCSAKMWIKQP